MCVCSLFFVILFLADILCQNVELICVCPPKGFVSSAKDGMSTQTFFLFFSFFFGGGGGGGMFCVLIPSFAECIFHVLFCLSLLTCKHFCCCHVDCILILVTHAHKVLFVEM